VQDAKRSRSGGPASICNAADAVFGAQPEGHGAAMRLRPEIVNRFLETVLKVNFPKQEYVHTTKFNRFLPDI